MNLNSFFLSVSARLGIMAVGFVIAVTSPRPWRVPLLVAVALYPVALVVEKQLTRDRS